MVEAGSFCRRLRLKKWLYQLFRSHLTEQTVPTGQTCPPGLFFSVPFRVKHNVNMNVISFVSDRRSNC